MKLTVTKLNQNSQQTCRNHLTATAGMMQNESSTIERTMGAPTNEVQRVRGIHVI